MDESWFDSLGGPTHIHGNLWRSPIPRHPRHVEQLQRAGVRVVFSFEETVSGHLLTSRGLDWRPHFWTDDAPVQPGQMERFLEDYLSVPEDTPVVVHCRAGWGRAGSAAACALMARYGFDAESALNHFWERVPGSRNLMRRNRQDEMVRGFHARILGRNPL